MSTGNQRSDEKSHSSKVTSWTSGHVCATNSGPIVRKKNSGTELGGQLKLEHFPVSGGRPQGRLRPVSFVSVVAASAAACVERRLVSDRLQQRNHGACMAREFASRLISGKRELHQREIQFFSIVSFSLSNAAIDQE